MSESASWKLVILAAISVMVLFSVDTYVIPDNDCSCPDTTKDSLHSATNRPVYSSKVVNMTEKVLTQHNETFRYIGIVQELTDKSNTGCNYVIQFQRSVNSNYAWVDKTDSLYHIWNYLDTLYQYYSSAVAKQHFNGGNNRSYHVTK